MTIRCCLTGLCLLAGLWGVQPVQAQIELFQLATVEDVPSRVDIRYDAGRGLGFSHDLVMFDAFLPVYQYEDVVFFTDGRGMFFDGAGMKQYNLGAGMRAYSGMLNSVLGLNAFYDNIDDRKFTFHQLGLGWEILGEYFDLRGNCYIPLGDNNKGLSAVDTLIGFQGNNILLGRTKNLEVAQRGLDVELGLPLPSPEQVVSRAAVGYYNYQGQGSSQVQGIRGRIQASVLDLFTVEAVVQNDKVFHTTAYAGVGFRFGGPSSHGTNTVDVRDRRAEPIQRTSNIVLRPQTERATTPIRRADNGVAFRIIHVNSAAAPGGDGTFERPFQTLAQAQTGSLAGDIIYAYAGSVLTGSNFLLQNNQNFFGEGISHVLQTTRGPFLLPRVTNNAALPIRQLSAGNTGVTLAQNNEVSGIDFRGAFAANGIQGTGMVGFFNIDRNRFSGFRGTLFPTASGAGVFITNATGGGLITNNTFGAVNYGILIAENNAASLLKVGIRDNTFGGSAANDLLASVQNGFLGLQYLRNINTTGTGITAIGAMAQGTIFLEPLVGNTPINPPIGVTMVPAGSLGLP